MKIQNGNKVTVHYTGTLDDGTVFDSSEGREPLTFEAGAGQLIKGFDEAVIGMEKGQEKDITIPPAEAYGDRDARLTKQIPRSALPKDKEPQVGMMLGLTTPDGQQLPAQITQVNDKEITIDLNHPLAGKTLHFKIKIVEIA